MKDLKLATIIWKSLVRLVNLDSPAAFSLLKMSLSVVSPRVARLILVMRTNLLISSRSLYWRQISRNRHWLKRRCWTLNQLLCVLPLQPSPSSWSLEDLEVFQELDWWLQCP